MIVYQLVSPSNKSYIGVAFDLEKRFKVHSRNRSAIGGAIRKHGAENFVKKTLLVGGPEYCYFMEEIIIDHFGTIAPKGYNMASGGKGVRRHHPKSRMKMSKSIRAAYASPEARIMCSERAKKLWREKPESLARSTESNSTTWANPEKKKEHSERMTEVFSNPEIRRKFSIKAKAQWADPILRERMVAALKAGLKRKREEKL